MQQSHIDAASQLLQNILHYFTQKCAIIFLNCTILPFTLIAFHCALFITFSKYLFCFFFLFSPFHSFHFFILFFPSSRFFSTLILLFSVNICFDLWPLEFIFEMIFQLIFILHILWLMYNILCFDENLFLSHSLKQWFFCKDNTLPSSFFLKIFFSFFPLNSLS